MTEQKKKEEKQSYWNMFLLSLVVVIGVLIMNPLLLDYDVSDNFDPIGLLIILIISLVGGWILWVVQGKKNDKEKKH